MVLGEREVGPLSAMPSSRRGALAPPADPLVTIRAGRLAAWQALREVWRCREVLYFLALRDLKIRYRQAALGIAWAILQPLLTMVLFAALFGRLARMPSDGVPYPAFVYGGLLLWIFFSNSATQAGNSFIISPNLLTKIYFPRAIVPVAAVAVGLADLSIALVLLVPLLLYFGIVPGWGALLAPVWILLCALWAAAFGLWAAGINVKYRDVRFALPFLLQVWMFATPVIYPMSFLPERWRWLALLNPMTGIVEGFRSALLGTPADGRALLAAVVFVPAVAALSFRSFQRVERELADSI